MEFYSTNAAGFVAMFAFMVPFLITIKHMSTKPNGLKRSNKQMAIAIAIMVSLQIIVAAYIPMIVNQFQKAGEATANLIIKSKNQ